MDLSKCRTVMIATTIGAAYMTWSMLIALQPSFYPSEAESKGAKPSQYGSVFGIAHLAACISAPIFGKFGSSIGPKVMYYSGAFVQGLCGIGFGCLHYCNNTTIFLFLSYTFRILGGTADAAAMGAMLAILMKLYPGKTGKIVAWTGSASGVGHMIGPALGSFLYSVGGFTLPFFVVGSTSLVLGFCLCLVVPDIESDKDEDNNNKENAESLDKKLTFMKIIGYPSILLPFLANFISVSGVGLLDSMLEPYLKKATGASQMQVGVCFLSMGALYMISNPIAGWACDKITQVTWISIIGHVIMTCVFVFLGPLPFIPLEPSQGLIQACVALFGLGYAPVKVSSFVRSQSSAIKNGFNDDMDTYSFISGMWTASFFLGNFMGPTVAGILVEHFEFRRSTLFFFGINCSVLLIDSAELIYNIFNTKRHLKSNIKYKILSTDDKNNQFQEC